MRITEKIKVQLLTVLHLSTIPQHVMKTIIVNLGSFSRSDGLLFHRLALNIITTAP